MINIAIQWIAVGIKKQSCVENHHQTCFKQINVQNGKFDETHGTVTNVICP